MRDFRSGLLLVGGVLIVLWTFAAWLPEREGDRSPVMATPDSSGVVSQGKVPQWLPKATLALRDTAVSIRWTLLALDLQQQMRRNRLQARVDAERGDSAALHALREASPLVAKYPWTLLALAQHEAARRADGANANVHASVAAASAEVTSRLFPAVRTQVLGRLDANVRAMPDTSGAAIGRQAARIWLAAFSEPSPPPIPSEYVGPMGWRSRPDRVPDGLDLAVAVPIVLDRANQFRPGPPPASGDQAFVDALAEVRRAAQHRTPAQRRAARFWALRNGATEWTRRAAHLLAREGISDPVAAAVFARLHAAITDATIACFEAKYHYGLLRPEHADSTITRPWAVGLPHFPAYPAGHACTAGAAETILTDALPGAETEIRTAAHEMAESRLWGGVHYRFDNEAGLALGRDVARFVMAHPERLSLF